MKARRSNIKGTSFGGIVPILKRIQDLGIPQLMRKCLGERVPQAKYQFHDVFIVWTLGAICGCKRLEQLTALKEKMAFIPGLKFPSHDTVGRIMKKKASETKIHEHTSKDAVPKTSYTHYNDNIELNRMLVQTTKRIEALKEGVSYTMDIDAMSVSTERRGALRKIDKKGKLTITKIGFNPLICLIGDLPVYLSMRNGNASAAFMLVECFKNCLQLLEESKIKVGRVVSDAAGFNKELMRVINDKGIKFNMRFPYKRNMHVFNKQIKNSSWRKTEIETANFFWDCEVTDINHTMTKHYFEKEEAQTYRVVVMRIPNEETRKLIHTEEESKRREMIKKKLEKLAEEKKLKGLTKPFEDVHWKDIGGYLYKFYVTNDYEKTSEEIIMEYNKRGNAERKFSFMKGDFAWNRPPFSEMNDNAVFMIAAAIANNIFRGVMSLFKEKIPGLKLSYRIDKFKSLFILTPCAYIKGRFVFFYQNIFYDELMI